MKKFDVVRSILEASVDGRPIGAHRNFWRSVDRETFVSMVVFGKKLIEPGDAAASNLIRALRGEAPFGRDLEPRPPGATMRRMPAGRAPVAEESIAFIAAWIDAGCPDEEAPSGIDATAMLAMRARHPVAAADTDLINTFFRVFDDFFLFSASPETSAAVGTFMGASQFWPGWSADDRRGSWDDLLLIPSIGEAARYIAEHHHRLVTDFFGSPTDIEMLNIALYRFGAGDLPDDPLRPQQPKHRMDGATMWLFWLSHVDAALRIGAAPATATAVGRVVVTGLVADALFRDDRPASDRLEITRYSRRTPNLHERTLADTAKLTTPELLDFNIGLAREALGLTVVA